MIKYRCYYYYYYYCYYYYYYYYDCLCLTIYPLLQGHKVSNTFSSSCHHQKSKTVYNN